ncbi:MAG: DsbA family protein [Holosporaceae bacterium]|jgi:protein-disulfide isomerase|nr:DsbA family protein [Holosporaceae bacterium]
MKSFVLLLMSTLVIDNLWGEAAKSEMNSNESFIKNLNEMHFPDNVTLKEIVIGDKNAPNTLIVYASFTCIHCREFFSEVYPEFEKQYINTGKGKIYLRIYLDSHATLESAALVRCFGGDSRDKISKLYRTIYTELEKWMQAQDPKLFLKDIFKNLGYSNDEIDGCLADDKISAGLMKEHQRAIREFQISLIPAFIINGKIHQGKLSFQELDKKLKEYSK